MLFARIKLSKWVTGSAGKLRVFRVKPLLGYDPGLKLLRFRLRYALMSPEDKLLAKVRLLVLTKHLMTGPSIRL